MDNQKSIIELLIEDHETVKRLFDKIESAPSTAEMVEFFTQLNDELALHSAVEEQIFYPRLEDITETSEIIANSFKEHTLVEQMLTDIMNMIDTNVNDDEILKQIEELKKNVYKHVTEEENNLFVRARQLIHQEELNQMTEEALEIKKTAP